MRTRRSLLVLFIALLIVFETIAYVATTPQPQEQFYQLTLLGAKHFAADYYPNNNTNVGIGNSVAWYLGVTNNVGSVELVEVRIKLGNQTTQPPDDQTGLPSPAPLLMQFHRFLQDNETWEFPLIWQVSNATSSGEVISILGLEINNQTIQTLNTSAQNGYNFRLIIELWTWNADSSSYQFGWYSESGHHIAWLQAWFNETATISPHR